MINKMINLYAHQREAVKMLLDKPSYFIVNGDPGVGKTAIALRYADKVRYERVVIVCPASVIGTWVAETAKWAPQRVLTPVTSLAQAFSASTSSVLSYARLSQMLTGKLIKGSNGKVKRGERMRVARAEVKALTLSDNKLTTLIIFDESHKLKNPQANCTAVAFALAAALTKCVCLSGTPAPDKLIDLHAQLRLGANMGPYNSRHLFGVGLCGLVPGQWGGYECKREPDIERLRQLTQDYMIRIDKDIVLDLPPKTYITLDVPIKKSDFEQINMLEDDLKAAGLLTKKESIDFTALKVLAGHVATYRQLVGKLKIKFAADWILDFCDSCDKPLVVFAYHTDVLDALKKACEKAKLTVSVLQGSTTPRGRERALSAFQAGVTRVFLAQIKAGSEGINLQRAHHVLFVEQDWSPGTMQQAEDRVHRIGQTHTAVFYSAMIKDTIDARLRSLLSSKRSATDAYQKAMNTKTAAPLRFRPSSADRWLACPGSVAITANIPSIAGTAAQIGTDIHARCETILKTRDKATITTAWQALALRYPEFKACARTYITHVRQYQNKPEKYTVWLEEPLAITDAIKGTADALIIDPTNKQAIVIDLKTGQHVPCSPAGKQLGLYAVGAYQRFKDSVDTVETHIVQPRLLTEVKTHVWSKQQLQQLKSDAERTVATVEAGTTELHAGTWCQFCPVKKSCTEFNKTNDIL